MHTVIKYLGAALLVAVAAVYIFGRVFSERPVWQGKAATIVVGLLVLLAFVLWLWFGPDVPIGDLWPQM